MSRIPLPPYPNGWFAVAHSDELAPGDVKPLHLLGRDFALWGRREWDINSHPQEIMENGVDFAHFVTLHGWKVKTIDWQPDGPFYRLKIAVDGEAQDQAATAEQATDVDSFNSGPGFLYTRAVGLMHGIVINCLAPVGPELLRLTHVYYHHKDCPREVYEGFFNAYVHDWDLDIAIWERKIHRPRPSLADGDGHFMPFRKWYRQFYSEDPAALEA